MTRKLSLLLLLWGAVPARAAAPKLVVALVIDQFRADNLTRFEKRFLPVKGGGFRYLMEKGAWFPFAQYDLLQPMTGPGHATILSGTYPYLGGIAVNDWYSEARRSKVYCVEDSEFETVGKFTPKDHLGTSPRNFLGTTVGDELKNAGWPSKVVAIALKDRAAILLGGHRADLALWADQTSFTWVSSRYYLPDGKLPDWVRKLNETVTARAGQTWTWEAKGPDTTITTAGVKRSGQSWKAIGDAFPHRITRGTDSELGSPGGIDLTEEAAEAAVDGAKLGQGRGPDLLALSFSSHDYVGHSFGPDSRENEEMVVAEDRALARLFRFLDRKVGLRNVVITLTGDHGVAPNAEWLAAHRIDAGEIDVKALRERLEKALVEKFGKVDGAPWISYAAEFNFWLGRAAIAAKKLTVGEVAAALKEALLGEKGVAYAFTAADVAARTLPPGMHERRILKTYVPGRSGDVVMIGRPFYYVKESTTTHMADYSYDESVPLLLAGPGIRAGKLATRAEVVDLAPTLAFLLGTLPPSLSEGRVLHEALEAGAGKAPK